MTHCSVDGCKRPHKARGLCSMHYQRWQTHGDPSVVGYCWDARPRINADQCSIVGCDRALKSGGLCNAHHARWVRTGDLGSPSIRRWTPRGQGINSPDYLRVTRAGRRVAAHRVAMEELLGRPLLPQENVHHINGIRDDNRPENLELWTTSQPSGQRVVDKIAWCVEFLSEYAPELLSERPVQLRVVN